MAKYTPIPAIINLDWLAFSVKLLPNNLEKELHQWMLNDLAPFGYKVVEFSGTNIYKRRAIIYNSDGEKLLTALFEPYSKVIPADSCLVEVANKWLYTSNITFDGTSYSEHNLQWVTDILYRLHPYVITNMSRVDICADFECSPEQHYFIRSLSDNQYYVQKYHEGSSFHLYDANDNYSKIPRCLSWGSKHSNVKWKLYNKSAEIFEWVKEGQKTVKYCHKPYIAEGWHATWQHETFNEDNVWRLEVSITPAEKFTFRDASITYSDIINQFFIDDLFLSMYMTRFVTRIRQGHKDRTNDKRVYLFPPVGLAERLRAKQPHSSREVIELVSGLRAAMLQRSKIEVQNNPKMLQVWTQTAKECVRCGHLESYFLKTYGLPVERINEISSVNLQTT